MTVLEEMTLVILSRPPASACRAEVARWYERKAALLDHIAAEGGPDADTAHEQAAAAREHARALLDEAILRDHQAAETIGARPFGREGGA